MKMLHIETIINRKMRADLFDVYVVGLRSLYPGAFCDREEAALKEMNEVTFEHDLFGSPATTTIRIRGRGADECIFWPCGQIANA